MSNRKQLGDLLVEEGIITVKTLERALERQKGTKKRLGAVLEEMGVITDEELAAALARQFGFKLAKGFAGYSFPSDLLESVPADMAVSRCVFPLKKTDQMLAVALADPFDNDTLDFLSKRNGIRSFPVVAPRGEIVEAVKKNYLPEGGRSDERRKVLVVDDTQSVATVIRVALEKEGYSVQVAADGIEGLKLALSTSPDLIICDSIMPRMDGYGLMNALKGNQATREIPIILLTSKASGEDEHRALESGFIDFIPKPVQPIRVVSRVKRVLEIVGRYARA